MTRDRERQKETKRDRERERESNPQRDGIQKLIMIIMHVDVQMSKSGSVYRTHIDMYSSPGARHGLCKSILDS